MAEVDALVAKHSAGALNVADHLAHFARLMPEAVAVACSRRRAQRPRAMRLGKSGAIYATITFGELDADATRIARGLAAWGVPPGTRLALLVKPGIEFVTLVFALLRAGMVIVLVDPGLGRRNLIRCLADARPEGFVAIGRAQAARVLLRHRFPHARWNVTVGRRWLWGGLTLDQLRIKDFGLRVRDQNSRSTPTKADDPAAIIFTSGSTGPAKGVLYTQRMFDTQVEEIQSTYAIEPGGIDLACFPLFALFNAAMGVTTVLPEMDFSRPATVAPRKLLAAANDWKVTQAFASPAVWRVLSEHCANSGERIDSLRQVFSCGAPVPAGVIRATLACVGDGAKMHTPYGATECLPVSTIEAAEILRETAARTGAGAGVCVGRKFEFVDWRIIRITDEPIARIEDAEGLPPGEIGELIVRGPQVSPQYVTHCEANAMAKIGESGDEQSRDEYRITRYSAPSPNELKSSAAAAAPPVNVWHRTGDVGYFDEDGRFWYCGRKSQRVETAAGTLYTECVEPVFDRHPDVEKAALVGIGPRYDQFPVVALKFRPRVRITRYSGRQAFADFDELAANVVSDVSGIDWLDFEEFPYDVRHNAKIRRELLQELTVAGVLPEIERFPPALAERAKARSST